MPNNLKENIKWVSEKQLVALLEKRGMSVNKNNLEKLEHGDFLLMIRNQDKLTETYYFLKKIFFKGFNMNYSAHQKSRRGKELLISNMELPRGSVFI